MKYFDKLAVFFKINLVLLAMLFLIRVFELFILGFKQNIPDYSYLLELHGFLHDIVYWLVFSFWSFLLFLTVSLLSFKVARFIHYLLSVLLLIVYVSLIQFFSESSVMLDHVVFSYSFNEMLLTTRAGGGDYGFLLFLPSSFVILLFIGISTKIKAPKIKLSILSLFLILGFASTFIFPKLGAQKQSEDEMAFKIRANKLVYFLETTSRYLKDRNSVESNESFQEARAYIKEYQLQHPEINYISEEYPLLHLRGNQNVLGPYFIKSNTKPNIVIFYVESLSSAFVGKGAYMGNFMPFLDSLIEHSLFWQNCLSTAERTFGVLPAVMGALPLSKSGFMALQENMPTHQTIMSILNDNGYYTGFYHEGPLGFDHTIDFVKYQNPDFILNFQSYLTVKNNLNKTTQSWGKTDDILFKESMNVIDTISISPRLDAYLTLTTHSPFNYPQQEMFIKKAKELNEQLGVSDAIKESNKKYLKQFGGFLFLDEAFRNLFADYKKRADFDNTIFILVGDHRMGTPPLNKMDKYRVPLIIYSPLLKGAVSFPAITTQQAIPVSLTNLLAGNYGLTVSDTVHWLSSGLDTSSCFQSQIDMPFMFNNRNIEEYIYYDKFYSRGLVYDILDPLSMELIDDDDLAKTLGEKIELYKRINKYIILSDKLMVAKNDFQSISIFSDTSRYLIAEGKSEYTNIFRKTKVKKEIRELSVDLEFDIEVLDSIHKMPIIIVEIRDTANKLLSWKRISIEKQSGEPIKKNVKERIVIKKKYDLNKYSTDQTVSIKSYFWNKKKIEYRVENMSIEITDFNK